MEARNWIVSGKSKDLRLEKGVLRWMSFIALLRRGKSNCSINQWKDPHKHAPKASCFTRKSRHLLVFPVLEVPVVLLND